MTLSPERAEPLRHDTLAAELAGLPVDDIAIADVVLVDRQAWTRLAYELGQRLFAFLDRKPTQVLTIEFEQVEVAEHGSVVVTRGTDQLEHRQSLSSLTRPRLRSGCEA